MAGQNNDDIVYATEVFPVPVTAGTETSAPACDGEPASSTTQPSNYRLPLSGASADIMDKSQVRQLRDQGFTSGLARALSSMKDAFPLRIWVVDNSGSMRKNDGHRMIETANSHDLKVTKSTRWAEIQECVNYHSQMAALLRAPTSFRLLNDPGSSVGPQQFGVAEVAADEMLIEKDVQRAREIMRKARPDGVTPLRQHIVEIHASLKEMAPTLTAQGKRVAIILATDGLPTDEVGYANDFENSKFINALRLLEGLPVWIVIRLCTDENDVVEFYNDLDGQLEVSIEVLDDFLGEAKEVHKKNKWLNYALPLHRCRELGFHDRMLDMIDERALTMGELRDFCAFLFGMENFDGVPDPAVDWSGFVQEIDRLNKKEGRQWNPAKKKPTLWIDMKTLNKTYGDGSACTMM